MNFLRWLFGPVVLSMGGDGGGGGSGQAAAEDEARKASLRDQIDRLYGVKTTKPVAAAPQPRGTGLLKGITSLVPGSTEVPDAEAFGAKDQMAADDASVSDATRGYYTDQLTRSFGAAERNNRFRLARQGLQGGSADVDSNAELSTDRNLGATRIDQAARAASASLDAQREQERMQAISLVNAGAGDSAISSAQTGLKNSLAQAQNTQKVNLFGDLFTTGANGVADANQNAALAQMMSRYNQQLASFFPTGSSGGRITPSS